jgi:hypothetical protein
MPTSLPGDSTAERLNRQALDRRVPRLPKRLNHPSLSVPEVTTPRTERGFWFFRFLLRALRFRVAVDFNSLKPPLPAFFAARTTGCCSLHSSVGMLVIVIADSPMKELVGTERGRIDFPQLRRPCFGALKSAFSHPAESGGCSVTDESRERYADPDSLACAVSNIPINIAHL